MNGSGETGSKADIIGGEAYCQRRRDTSFEEKNSSPVIDEFLAPCRRSIRGLQIEFVEAPKNV